MFDSTAWHCSREIPALTRSGIKCSSTVLPRRHSISRELLANNFKIELTDATWNPVHGTRDPTHSQKTRMSGAPASYNSRGNSDVHFPQVRETANLGPVVKLRSSPSAAKAVFKNNAFTAAVNRCATQNLVQNRLFSQAESSYVS